MLTLDFLSRSVTFATKLRNLIQVRAEFFCYQSIFFLFFHVSFHSCFPIPWSIIYYTNFELYRDDSIYLLYVILRCRAIPRSISALSDFLLLFYDEKHVSIVRCLDLNLLHFYVSEICLDDLTTQFNEEGLDCDTDCPVPCR